MTIFNEGENETHFTATPPVAFKTFHSDPEILAYVFVLFVCFQQQIRLQLMNG